MIQHPTTPRRRDRRHRGSPHRGLAALASLAIALPVAGLLWAAHEAHAVVVDRVLAGETATARGVAVEVSHGLDAVLQSLPGAAARPNVVDGTPRGDAARVARSLDITVQQEPLAGMAVYGAGGRPLASAGAPVAASLAAQLAAGRDGRLRFEADRALQQHQVPITAPDGRRVGTLVVDVALDRVVPDLALQRFGRSGASTVVDADGTIALSADRSSQGQPLLAAATRRMAAARADATAMSFSPRYHRNLAQAYVPVPGTTLGVITRQDQAEAFAGADRLTRLLRVGAAVSGLLGLGLVLVVAVLLRRERRRVEDRDAQIRHLVAGSPDVIARFDADGTCVYVSPAVEALTGYTVQERLGRDGAELVHPDDQGAFLAAQALLATQDTAAVVYRSRHRDGHWSWFETITTVERRADRTVGAHNVVTRDVTARREGELLREQAAVDAARARDEALAASRAKTAILANTSHEVRTPLVGVLGLTELLLASELTPQQRDWAGTVQQSGRQLLGVLDDVLDLAKIEAGKVVLEDAPFDVVQLVRHAVAAARPAAATAGLELRLDEPTRSHWVRGDARRTGQVVANLVGNDVKFTPTGSVVVTVSWATDLLTVVVADTGVGIAADRLGSLFQPFEQADTSTTRRFGGTGLGLSVSRQLAGLLGGTLTVESREGVGSTFTVSLPLPEVASAPAVPSDELAPLPGSGLRVLLAEDNTVNQKVGAAMLTRLGYDVSVVGDGNAAVEAVQAHPGGFVAVLMDCQMPVLDGYGATAAIRLLPGAAARVPILALTASAMVEERVRGLSVGMDGYLTKPISLPDLSAALARVVPAPRRPV